MATDQTPPATGRIAKIALGCTLFLILVQYAAKSYFNTLTGDELERKVYSQPATQLTALRAADQAKLKDIGDAKRQVATQPRSALPAIAPEASEDKQAIRGWTELPQ